MTMHLADIAPGAPFLPTLARHWLACNAADPARGMILLPTRRAARALAAAFTAERDGEPMLLPRIAAFGALDEAPLALAGALDLPPAIGAEHRLAALSALILRLPRAQGGTGAADQAWALASELAALMDDAERHELDLPSALARATGGEHARHWQITLDFLAIVTRRWPDILASEGVMNPAARQVLLLHAQARAWQDAPPDGPVWVAGTTAGLPAVARLLGCVARLPDGLVVLPGLDRTLAEATWAALPPSHPQAGLARLLADLGARRDDAAPLGSPPVPALAARAALLGRALLPAGALHAWREPLPAAAGLSRLSCADAQAEAAAAALVLRGAIETPGRTAALVTPDRALAVRVSAELLRFGIVVDDSAGETLADTPPAVFLRLLARAAADGLAPVALLSVLKHPLAAAGLDPPACRAAARALEFACLRGPRIAPGITGLRRAAADAQAGPAVHDLLTRIERCLAPLLRLFAARGIVPHAAMVALIEAAEALAGTDADPGSTRLWSQEEGAALAERLAALLEHADKLPEQPADVLPGLLDAMLDGAIVRSRRALRGRDQSAEHPRVFIWGRLEARLQAVDTVVLAGLTEGTWPAPAEPGPWMSRSMRDQAGFASTEEQVGAAAHDFASACCAAPEAVLCTSRRRDHAPAVPSRWLVRLDALLRAHGQALPDHPAAAWAGLLDQPAGAPRPVRPPRPAPPVALRPRRLNVTEVGTWVCDPYAIYARRVLRLRALDPLEQDTDSLDYGKIVHAGLCSFLQAHGTGWPDNAAEKLREDLSTALVRHGPRDAVRAWWLPRLERIADWVAGQERERRAAHHLAALQAEVPGDWPLPGLGFVLHGRADRIERRQDGGLAIVDYKTGTQPSGTKVASGEDPQLLLEAAMVQAGAFGPALQGEVRTLEFWKLSGGRKPGEATVLFGKSKHDLPGEIAAAADRLADLIRLYDSPARCYLARPIPARAARFAPYAQLARVDEWSLMEDEP